MNNNIGICAVEAHSGKSVKIQHDQYGMLIHLHADGHGGSLHLRELDEQLLDMLVNVILDFKSQVAESRRRASS